MKLLEKTVLWFILLMLLSLTGWSSDTITVHNQYIAPHVPLTYSLDVPEGATRLVAKVTWNSNTTIHDLFMTLDGGNSLIDSESECELVLGYSGQCVVNRPAAGNWELTLESYRSRNFGLEFFYY